MDFDFDLVPSVFEEHIFTVQARPRVTGAGRGREAPLSIATTGLAARHNRKTRIFADGAIAAATGATPVPPIDLSLLEQGVWLNGFDYHQPSFLNLYASTTEDQ